MKRAFERILVIMFENQYREYVLANPYMQGLARQGIDMANFHGVMHPSQTNYIASIAGELCNVTDDESPGLLPQRTIVDLIEEAPGDLQWKAYMDAYRPAKTPWTPTLVPQDDYPYVIKHDPFSSFVGIVRNEARWKRIVDETQFFMDVLSGDLPHYAWLTPDMWNDGHYLDGTTGEPEERAPALVDQLARWLRRFFDALRFPGPDSLLPEGTLVVVTFDESDFEKEFDEGKKYTYDGPNQVYTVLLGDMIEPGVQDEAYNHYNLLRTIELNFGLGDLGKNDAGAAPMRFLWGQRFGWNPPVDTPVRTDGQAASAALDDALHVVARRPDGALEHVVYARGAWGTPRPIGVAGRGALAMAAHGKELVLMYAAAGNEQGKGQPLCSLRYTAQTGWSEAPQSIGEGEACAITAFASSEAAGLMAVWVDPAGRVQSRRHDHQGWGETVDTGHRTDGALCIAALGPSIVLVFQTAGSTGLSAVTYNTASFNTTTLEVSKYSGPWDDTTKDQWSPTAIPVGRFGAAAFSGTPEELEPVTVPAHGGPPLAMVEHDGTLHLVHAGVRNRQLLTERFSVPGILTPKLPISYKATEDKTTNNGYGTLAEAGWTGTEPIDHTWVAEGGALTTATVGDEVVLLAQGEAGGTLQMSVGRLRAID